MKKPLILSIISLLSVTGCSKTNDNKVEDSDAKEVVEEVTTEEESDVKENEAVEKIDEEEIPPIPKDFDGPRARWNPNTKKWEVPDDKLKTDEELGVVKLPLMGSCDIAGANMVYTMPNVVGATLFDKDYGFGKPIREIIDKYPLFFEEKFIEGNAQEGTIIKQYPAPGSKVRGYAKITVWTCGLNPPKGHDQGYNPSEEDTVIVPNIVGMKKNDAVDMTTKLCLKMASSEYIEPDSIITYQSISPGTKVPIWSFISYSDK